MSTLESDRPSPVAPEARRRNPAVWLLVLPLIGTLIPYFYNRSSPELGGMPFFYWYQLVWIPVAVACTWVVYRATRSPR